MSRAVKEVVRPHAVQSDAAPISEPASENKTAGARLGKIDRRAANSSDFEYMSDTSAAFLQQSPGNGRLMLWLCVLCVAAAIFWASRAAIDEVTTGTGKVVPSRQVQVVQNLEGGIVAELMISEGDVVEEDEVLLRIDDTRFASSFRENKLRFLALKAKAARLRAEATGSSFIPPPDVPEKYAQLVERERALFDSRAAQLDSTVAILNQQIAQRREELEEMRARKGQVSRSRGLVQQELTMTSPLVAAGAISEVEVLRLRREVSELRGELDGLEHSIPRVESQLNEANRKVEEARLSFQNTARAELNDTVTELQGLSESSTALEDRVTRTSVRSPVRGTVKRLMITTVGGVVQPGMDLVEIVPLEDTLLVEAQVRPSDIAFLRAGQAAIVKFTAYDFAIYGGLAASVERISADTIADDRGETFYQVLVRTDRNYLGSDDDPLPLIPGMLTEVDILTGKKTVLEYLLKPVLRARDRALRER